MLNNPLHLLTAWQTTVCVTTLARVHQRLNAPLDGQFPRLLRIRLPAAVTRADGSVVQVEAELLHLVRMADLLVARWTEIVVLWKMQIEIQLTGRKNKYEPNEWITYFADCAMVASFDVCFARVASVDKSVRSLVMQLVQHRHGWKSVPTQRWKFVVLLASHCQEGVATVHQVALQEGIGVGNRRQVDRNLYAVQPYHKKYLKETFFLNSWIRNNQKTSNFKEFQDHLSEER